MAAFNDLFTGSASNLSSHTADSGEGWNAPPGSAENPKLSGTGQLYTDSGGTVSLGFSAWVPTGTDYIGTITWQNASSSAGEVGMVMRGSTGGLAGNTSFYLGRYSLTEGGYSVMKCTNGSYSLFGSNFAASVPATGNTMAFKVEGTTTTTLTLIVNGSTVITATDSSSPFTAKGSFGVWLAGTGSPSTGIQIDRLQAIDVLAEATEFTLTGPSAGVVSTASTSFTLTPNLNYTGTITPTDSGASGIFSPTSLTWSDEISDKTFTYTPATTGTKTISAAASPTLTPPSSLTYTSYSLSLLPSSQSVGNSVIANLTATLTGGGAGSLSASTDVGTLSTASPTSGVVFTLTTPGSGYGTATVTVTHNVSGAEDEATVTFSPAPADSLSLSGPTSGIVGEASTNFTVSANGSLADPVTITLSDGGAGGTFSPTSLILSDELLSDTFTYTISSTATVAISITNDGGLDNPDSIDYTGTTSGFRQLSVNFGTARGSLSTVGYRLVSRDYTTLVERTTADVNELYEGSGLYGVVVTLPLSWSGWVVWDSGESIPVYASDESISKFEIADALLVRNYTAVENLAGKRSLAAAVALGTNWTLDETLRTNKNDGSPWYEYDITTSSGAITSVS